jgi:fibronectin type 3 domain-containing protein
MRAVLPLLVALALGCTAAFDLERVRGALAPPPEPVPPPLVERPPAALPAVQGVRPVSGQLREIPLKWDPLLVGDVAGYTVERAVPGQGPFQRVATVLGRFVTSYTDKGRDLAAKHASAQGAGDLGDGNTYLYRVRAFDAGGHVAPEPSEPASATTAAAPARPTGFTVYSHLPRRVALTWDPVEDPTVTGYAVYRSPAAGGEFREVARLSGAYATTWVDENLGPLRVFYYRVAAVNAAGGEGHATPEARAVTKPEPLPPSGLAVASQRLGANVLRWEPNVEPDVAGYRLQRRREGADGWDRVATLGPEQTSADDAAVGAGERVAYRLRAFDADGLESDPSDPIVVTSVDFELRAEAEGGAVRLSWSRAVHAELAAVRVLREGTLGEDELGRATEPLFVHAPVDPGSTQRYRIVGVRSDGSETPPSSVLEVEVPR